MGKVIAEKHCFRTRPPLTNRAGDCEETFDRHSMHTLLSPIMDHAYLNPGRRELGVDLLLPFKVTTPPPLVLVIHGGGWRQGTRKDEGSEWLLGRGFALARIDYRYSNEASFPAQLEDCRAALVWLRAHATMYGYDPKRICALGTSAGGLLALLLGTDAANDLRAVVAYCAPTDLIARAAVQPRVCEKPGGSVHDLLGGPVSTRIELARAASPARQVRANSAPVLLLNGTSDATVLAEQPLAFISAALTAGHGTECVLVPGAPHCGDAYQTPPLRNRVAEFLQSHC